jgi:hypothetical protein
MRLDRFRTLVLSGIAASLLAACSKSTVRPGFSDPGFSLDSLRSGSSGLVVSGNARVAGFQKSFDALFGTGDSLAAWLSARILDSLNQGRTPIAAYALPAFMIPFPGDVPVAPPQSPMPRPAVPSYVIRIRNIAVEKILNEVPSTLLPSGSQIGMVPAGGGTSEACVVSFDGEVWETATMTMRHSFSVTARADVTLYAYKTALRGAVKAAARRTAWHLRGK